MRPSSLGNRVLFAPSSERSDADDNDDLTSNNSYSSLEEETRSLKSPKSFESPLEALQEIPSFVEDVEQPLVPLVPGIDKAITAYAEYLWRIGAVRQRSELLQFTRGRLCDTGYPAEQFHVAFEPPTSVAAFGSNRVPKRPIKGLSDPSGPGVVTCSLCNLSARGLVSVCLYCRHGGHSDHMRDWFKGESVCPTGCGCVCRMQGDTVGFEVTEQEGSNQSKSSE
jgi:hypothetical protein